MSESPDQLPPSGSSQTDSQTPPAEVQSSTTEAPKEPFEVAVLALQNLTLFPETVVPLGVGRLRSIAAVESALATPEKLLGCMTVRTDSTNEGDATSTDLYQV